MKIIQILHNIFRVIVIVFLPCSLSFATLKPNDEQHFSYLVPSICFYTQIHTKKLHEWGKNYILCANHKSYLYFEQIILKMMTVCGREGGAKNEWVKN